MSIQKQSSPTAANLSSSETVNTVGETVGTFASRMKRRLEEQRIRGDESQRETEKRHSRVLHAMTIVRKALQDTEKIQMGERFRFNLVISDWEGWPRVELRLVDLLAPMRVDHSLLFSVNDANGLGTINMITKAGELLGRIHLCEASELNRLALILKRTVRQFLDIIGVYVLNPKRPDELVEVVAKPINFAEQVERPAPSPVDQKLKEADIFSDEDETGSGNLVAAIGELTPVEGF